MLSLGYMDTIRNKINCLLKQDINSRIADPATKLLMLKSLNRGKRMRSVLVLHFTNNEDFALATEYLHTVTMLINRTTPRDDEIINDIDRYRIALRFMEISMHLLLRAHQMPMYNYYDYSGFKTSIPEDLKYRSDRERVEVILKAIYEHNMFCDIFKHAGYSEQQGKSFAIVYAIVNDQHDYFRKYLKYNEIVDIVQNTIDCIPDDALLTEIKQYLFLKFKKQLINKIDK